MAAGKGIYITERLKNNILAVKTALGLTIRHVAEATGVAGSTIYAAFGGTRKINNEWPDRFCELYHVDKDWLFNGSGDPVFTGKATTVETKNSDGAYLRLAEVRKEMGVRQTVLAAKLGISRQMYSRIETKGATVTPQVAERFENEFGIGAEWLLYGDESKKKFPVCSRMIEYLWDHESERERLWEKMKEENEGTPRS